MEFQARHKWIRLSPQKARLVANVIRGMDVQEALDTLKFMPQKAALLISRAVHSALANAREHKSETKPDVDKLYIQTLAVDEGPIIRRMKPRAYGRANRKRRRTSHIFVVLAERPAEKIITRRHRRVHQHPLREHEQKRETTTPESAPDKPKKPRLFGTGRKQTPYGARVKAEGQPKQQKEKATGEHRKTEGGTKGGSKKK